MISSRHAALALIIPLILVEASLDGGLTLSYKYLVDHAIVPGNGKALLQILGLLSCSFFFVSFLGFWRDDRYSNMVSSIIREMRNTLFERCQRLPSQYYESHSQPEILAKFSSDIAVLETWMDSAVNTLLLPAGHVAVSVALLFVFLPWPMALGGAMIWPLVLIGPRFLGPRAAAAARAKKKSESVTISTVSEILGAQKLSRLYALDLFTKKRFDQSLVSLNRDTEKASWLGMMVERSTVVTIYGIQVMALSVGAWLAFHGQITLGTFIAFLTVFWNLGATIVVLARSSAGLVSAIGSIRHIDELLEEKEGRESHGGIKPGPLQESIRIENVHLDYEGHPGVLRGVSMEIMRGQFVAIVGASGSGKSSLLNLLIPFHQPDQGQVMADGLKLEDMDVRVWRSRMGFVLQKSLLFNTSLRENIRLGSLGASDSEVEAAARKAELHECILKLPQGYETIAGARGSLLSGGQLQRLAIARALIRKPDILLLDEATSALDPAAEAAVNETLHRATHDCTTISVTHRLASITGADRIFVLQEGILAESGSHEELLSKQGVYAGLWRKQNGFMVSPDGALAKISVERLREIDLLRPLNEAQLEALVSKFICERVLAGHEVLREGDHSELFYVIARGVVTVTRQGQKLGEMSQGDEFGEMGLLNDAPRNATITAMTDCLFLTLTRKHFFDLLEDSPDVKKQVENIIAKRIENETVSSG
jgi:ATP-binding cassette subfamily B protein